MNRIVEKYRVIIGRDRLKRYAGRLV